MEFKHVLQHPLRFCLVLKPLTPKLGFQTSFYPTHLPYKITTSDPAKMQFFLPFSAFVVGLAIAQIDANVQVSTSISRLFDTLRLG